MRSLRKELFDGCDTAVADFGDSLVVAQSAVLYANNLGRLKKSHHAGCLFNRKQACFPAVQVSFDNAGMLHGEFVADKEYQGYDGMVHGGVLSGMIDACMAQCLMGHGMTGYTIDLAIKYRRPVALGEAASLAVKITDVNIGILYSMKCEIVQNKQLAVQATGRFCKFES